MSDNESPLPLEPMDRPDAGPADPPGDPVEPGSSAGDDDLAALLARREKARPNRWTWALVGLLLVAVGFVGGAVVQKSFGSSSTTRSGFAGGFPSGGFTRSGETAGGTASETDAGGLAPPAGVTFGTVKLVDGTNLYVEDRSGQTIKVQVPDTATVTAPREVPLSDFAAGTTVVIRGEAAADGVITATSVSEGGGGGGLPGAGAFGSDRQVPGQQAPNPSTPAAPPSEGSP